MVCTEPLPKERVPSRIGAMVVLQGAGDDLRGRGRAAVDQHHHRQAVAADRRAWRCSAAAVAAARGRGWRRSRPCRGNRRRRRPPGRAARPDCCAGRAPGRRASCRPGPSVLRSRPGARSPSARRTGRCGHSRHCRSSCAVTDGILISARIRVTSKGSWRRASRSARSWCRSARASCRPPRRG